MKKYNKNDSVFESIYKDICDGKMVIATEGRKVFGWTKLNENPIGFYTMTCCDNSPDSPDEKITILEIITEVYDDGDDIYSFDTLKEFCETALKNGWEF